MLILSLHVLQSRQKGQDTVHTGGGQLASWAQNQQSRYLCRRLTSEAQVGSLVTLSLQTRPPPTHVHLERSGTYSYSFHCWLQMGPGWSSHLSQTRTFSSADPVPLARLVSDLKVFQTSGTFWRNKSPWDTSTSTLSRQTRGFSQEEWLL